MNTAGANARAGFTDVPVNGIPIKIRPESHTPMDTAGISCYSHQYKHFLNYVNDFFRYNFTKYFTLG